MLALGSPACLLPTDIDVAAEDCANLGALNEARSHPRLSTLLLLNFQVLLLKDPFSVGFIKVQHRFLQTLNRIDSTSRIGCSRLRPDLGRHRSRV